MVRGDLGALKRDTSPNDDLGIHDAVTRIMRVAEDGRCSEVDAGLAVGAWATWYHHPSLREDLFDGTLDLTRLGEILQLAGLDAPWEELRER